MKKTISKIITGIFVSSLLYAAVPVYASTFLDVSYTNEHSDAISYLQSNNIVQGYEDNTFRPDIKINRVEFLKIVLEGTKVPLDSNTPTGFTDVDENQWYGPYLKKAKDKGWIQGYPDGTFRPLNPINKVEALKILGEVQQWDKLALGEVPEAPFKDTYRFSWYTPYVYFAKQNDLLFEETDYLNPAEEITRGYMAEIVYRSIIYNVILYKPGQTAEDKIVSTPEVETPDDFTLINADFFDDVKLSASMPNTFYINEVYIIEGEITNGKNYSSIFAFLAGESKNNTTYKHMVGEVTGNKFTIPLVFRNAGTYQFGIIPGSSGESKIVPITVLNGIPPEGTATNSNKASSLKINFKNDINTVSWDDPVNNVFRIYYYQNSTVHSYFVRNKRTLDLLYNDFKNFNEGQVSWRIYSAKASSLAPVVLDTKWNKSSDNIFNAVTHNFKLSIDDSITYTTIPEKLASNKLISVSGKTTENMFAQGAVITPKGAVEYFDINTSGTLLEYFGNDIIPAGASFNFSYDPTETGTYILELNSQSGSALLNIPIYIGDIYPLIPDFFDLQDPFEEVYDLNLTALRDELLNYINVERAVHKLPPVSIRDNLNNLSQAFAQNMADNNFFSHIDLEGGTPDSRRIDMGIKTDVGENLALAPSVYFGHQALMRSAIHRENILNPDWDQVGIGITLDGNGDMLIVEEFSHHLWTSIDLENLENRMLDKINSSRSINLNVSSLLRDIGREWSSDMINYDFFSFKSPSGINLIDMIQNRGVTDEGKAFILKEGTIDSLFNKLIEDSDITMDKWRNIGLGMKQNEWSDLYLTVIYTD